MKKVVVSLFFILCMYLGSQLATASPVKPGIEKLKNVNLGSTYKASEGNSQRVFENVGSPTLDIVDGTINGAQEVGNAIYQAAAPVAEPVVSAISYVGNSIAEGGQMVFGAVTGFFSWIG